MKTINVYVVHIVPTGDTGDDFSGCPTYDMDAAISKARCDWDHMTQREQSTRQVYVGAHRVTVPADDDRTAEQLMNDLIDDDAWPADHDVIWDAMTNEDKEDTTMVINKHGHKIDFDAAIQLMDDEIREQLHDEGYETEQEFFSAYEQAHEAKYGEEWELSKANPVW